MVMQEPRDLKVLKGNKESLDQKDLQETKVKKDLRGLKDILGHGEK
jgi:hypothetical protein